MEAISYTPIGIIRTPHTAIAGMPVQNVGAEDVRGTIEIAPEYAAGLQDLEGFSHLILLCHLHQMSGHELLVRSFIKKVRMGRCAVSSPRARRSAPIRSP
ncbi:MAG: TrmO family methyltransferase [Thermomicrobiales bacterium]